MTHPNLFETNEINIIVYNSEARNQWAHYHKGELGNAYITLYSAMLHNPGTRIDARSWGLFLADLGKLVSGRIV